MKYSRILVKLLVCMIIAACSQSELTQSEKASVKEIMQKVADWQINNFNYSETGSPGYLHDYGIDAWTNAVLYVGMFEWAKMADSSATYFSWLNEIGQKKNWILPENFVDYPAYGLYHADEYCMGQFYVSMSEEYKNHNMRIPTQKRLDWIIANQNEQEVKGKKWWSWCDALFMAPPVYAQMSVLTGNDSYVNFMDKEFKKTYNALYDKDEKLFFRDKSYFDKKEENGRKVFWGRGNGWVAAGIVNILKYIPANSPERSFYEELLKEHVNRLLELSDENGTWHASLLDPESYPAPEASATALITYALAYGINQGLFNKEQYLPRLMKSWNALTQMVHEDGKLGWTQPIGADPRKVTNEMTAVYGVGAFLLAGSEIYKL